MKKIFLWWCLIISTIFLYSSGLSTKVYATTCSANQIVWPNWLCLDKLTVEQNTNTASVNKSDIQKNNCQLQALWWDDYWKEGNADCKKSFSCESLFETDHAKARICNRNRCIAEKWYTKDEAIKQGSNNSCNCKYGENGDGKNIGIPLNTSIPFIGRCVSKSSGAEGDDSSLNAFPQIISAATKMLVTVILLVSFVMIVVGGVQWASWDAKSGKAKITKVAIGIAMLGMMGAILRLINPNFFK